MTELENHSIWPNSPKGVFKFGEERGNGTGKKIDLKIGSKDY